MNVVDDSVFQVLSDAWAAVGVPADRYWRCSQHLRGGSSAAMLPKKTPSSPHSLLGLRVPNPLRLHSSFYPTRVEALAARGYGAHRGLLPIALDRRSGSGSKLFNVLPRWSTNVVGIGEAGVETSAGIRHGSAVADFVSAIPHTQDRNLYALVDESCPVDPYFDLDFAYDPDQDDPSDALLVQSYGEGKEVASVTAFSAEAVEKVLLTMLTALRREVETELKTTVAECLVLTSSLQIGRRPDTPSAPASLEQLKLSFHVHFRLADRAVLASVREMHHFVTRLRSRLQNDEAAATTLSLLGSPTREKREEARQASSLLLRCVDFGVYTRWRAFRLPYNVKAFDAARSSALVSGAGDDLLEEQLQQLGIALPDNGVGRAAPSVLQNLFLAADVATHKAQRYLLKRLEQHFRFLLPVLPGATELRSAALAEFLSPLVPRQVRAAAAELSRPSSPTSSARDVVSAWVMELACIVRDASTLPHSRDDGAVQESTTSSSFRLLLDECTITSAAAKASAQATSNTFDVPLPPMPRSVRVRVEDAEMKRLLAEVFWCIAPEYGGPGAVVRASPVADAWNALSAPNSITPERINAHYEDSIRAYYVFQKQNKYCVRLHRNHKATFAQLYLTFGSIKIRCYANDCCDRCCIIPWEAPDNPKSGPQYHAGYPRYERLVAIRNALFPPLSTEELVRRYGTSILHYV
ncbi:conserved hypothetical protein [Leishmania major strain Friedlin]|uniref:PrimPol-like protein 2 n=1 Tax=Leishmania major TaxID=5664 RepID=Q4Q3J8_LEIMA|nr:conserved hypothetical protein [Leishmania major strain Friedlin]CAG9581721.1 PrimPol-like_protein_2_-_putative [Leishmania major strain Friedlin]CAJ07711.1 conserved hypothetical protein [Leishmania major strain Friedlin]|eukprot:XP_001686100.1 conserved hypothetical protein [Leishmania major strain Friedlin]